MTATANMIKQARGEPTLPHVRNAGLARLLAQLDLVSATGVITTSRKDTRDGDIGEGRAD